MANITSPSRSTPQPPSSSLPEGLSPDSIDTIPVLSAILTRLQNLSPNSTTTAASPLAASPTALASTTSPLTIKDIPAATDNLKHKLQKARVQVAQLPDIHRSIEEQEEEIRELEERIRTQRTVLKNLKEVGLQVAMERKERINTEAGDAMET